MDFVAVLDKILLSNDVVTNFYKCYDNEIFKNKLLAVLPEVESCKNQQQDTPWHIYSVLNHILKSVEEMNKQTQNMSNTLKRVMAYTMFLHDIGKPQCHTRHFSKMFNRDVDSFYNHNIVSEKIADRVLRSFRFNKKESKLIKLLVREHDLFLNVTLEKDLNPYHKVLSKDLVSSYISKFDKYGNGKEILNMLVKVGRTDNKAQNLKMSKYSLKMLDMFEKILDNAKPCSENKSAKENDENDDVL